MRRTGKIAVVLLLLVVTFAAAEQEKKPSRFRWKFAWRTVTVKTLYETKSRHLRYFYDKRLEVYGIVKNDTGRPIVSGRLLVEVYKRTTHKVKGTPDRLISWAMADFGRVQSPAGSTAKWSCRLKVHGNTGAGAGKLRRTEYIRVRLRNVKFEGG